ncbi:MAG: biopolymer transporter ExbD [Gammaproteobacteria bacterium]|nr:biopolymer transporter ExbD [Gammaproteobacteria bacterium]
MNRRHHKTKTVSLNLVSLMDIFTILVFFLLVNSSEVTELPSTRDVVLPESISQEAPRETVVVKVTATDIRVQGETVAKLTDVMRSNNAVIPQLQGVLARDFPKTDSDKEREITILGDKDVRYAVLRKIMASCASADFDRVSLAVMQKAGEAPTGIGVTT